MKYKISVVAFVALVCISTGLNAQNRAPWTTPGRLTLSFGEDNTDIGGYPNQLFTAFDSVVSDEQLESLIILAFQEWAALASINVGIVDDDPTVPFGTGGATQTNDLVGDIRIGALPMAGDVYAIAVHHDDFLSGGWAGTMLFNSNASFVDADQIYAVALHEAGHILGLDHSDNVNSVMHPTALNVEFDAEDIAKIRQLYGTRNLDQYDAAGQSNDTMDDATDIEDSGSIRGVVPTIAFGDISEQADVDYFVLKPREDYDGSLTTLRLINRGISAINLRMTVIDELGTNYGTVTGVGGRGDDISIPIHDTVFDLEYFVKIEAVSTSPYAIGSYALVTTFEGEGLLDPTTLKQIEPIIKRFLNFEDQEEIQELFCIGDDNSCPFFDTGINDDHGPDLPMNDTFATATVLEPLLEFPNEDRFRAIASLSTDLTDVDYYRVTAPNCSTLFVELTALEVGGPICDVELFDTNENSIAGEVIVNGNGELLVQFENLTPNDDYFVKVIADDPVIYATGNYQLDLTFCLPVLQVDELATGILTSRQPVSKHSLYVARSQLFHWSLFAESQGMVPFQLEEATIWMTVINEEGRVVHRVATRLDEKRSSRSVVLRPGSYSIRVKITFPNSFSPRFAYKVAYRIDGEGLSDPTGPEIIDGSNDPFAPCDKVSQDFCYPNDIQSSDPFIIVDFDGFEPIEPPTDPPWNDPNWWYWQGDWLG